jgi:hypothetical protein
MPNIVLTTEQQEAKRVMYDGINAYQFGAQHMDKAGDKFAELYNRGLDKHLLNKDGEQITATDAYIAAACGCDRATIGRLMAASTVRALLPTGNKPLPERVVRPLARFVPDRRKLEEPSPGWEAKVENAYERACAIAEEENSPKVKSQHTSKAVRELVAAEKWRMPDATVEVPAILAPLDPQPSLVKHLSAALDSLNTLESGGHEGARKMRPLIHDCWLQAIRWSEE